MDSLYPTISLHGVATQNIMTWKIQRRENNKT
jgi:hypothetical protein